MAALYDPLAELDMSIEETSPQEKFVNEFRTTWEANIIEKNLFSPERKRPSAKLNVNTKYEEIKPPEIVLKGVMLTRSGLYEAYIEVEKNQPVLVREGQTLEDIYVMGIKEKTVTLKWKNKIIKLDL
jgi:hypothetical protein